MSRLSALCVCFLLLIIAANPASAQDLSRANPVAENSLFMSPLVTAMAVKDEVRITALALARRMRLEVLSQTGESLYNSGSQPGNRLEWSILDQQGSELRDGSYGLLVTIEDFYGQVSHRRGIMQVRSGVASFGEPAVDGVGAAAADSQESLTILRGDDSPPFTLVSHDGKEGWVESATGGLNFYAGSLSRQKDNIPHLSLTEEGNVGIGVKMPQAKLDVAGLIRTTEGIQFSDGSVLKVESGFPILVIDTHQGVAGNADSPLGPGASRGTPDKTGNQTTRVLAARGGTPDRLFGLEGGAPLYNTFYGLSAGAITTGASNSFFGQRRLSNTTG